MSSEGVVQEQFLAPVSHARTQLGHEAASHIRSLIMSGQVVGGEYLRPEALAEAFGMSATPVREALLALKGEGFLRLEPRRGFVVLPLSAKDIKDLFAAQALIGGELAARAAALATAEDIKVLEDLHAQLIQASKEDRRSDMETLNHAFHRSMNKIADSPKLAWFLSMTTRYVPYTFYSSIEGWPEATIRDHATILEGLRLKRQDLTRVALAEHINNAGELLAEHIMARQERIA